VAFVNALQAHWNCFQIPQWKSGSISPYFLGENRVAFRVKCIMAHITLFSPNFCCGNMARRCHIFTAKIWHSFALGTPWCINRVSYLYMACINMLELRHVEAHRSIECIMLVTYTSKLMSVVDTHIMHVTYMVGHAPSV